MGPVRPSILFNAHMSAGQAVHLDSNERKLYRELQAYNASGDMVTYDVATRSWVPWTRPVRVLQSGALTAVAASGFNNLSALADQYEPPICPHAANLAQSPKYSRMELSLRRKYQGKVVDYFQVPRSSHACPFVVVIPPLQPPQVLYTQEEIDEHTWLCSSETEAAELRELSSYDRDFLQDFSSSSSPSKASATSTDEVGRMLTASGSSDSATSPLACSSSSEHRLFPLAPFRNNPRARGYNPRMLPDLSFGEGPRSSPRPITAAGRRATAFFTEEVAAARRASDSNLMSNLHYNEDVGLYAARPELHPAWDEVTTPRILQPYDSRIYPGCANRIFQNLTFLDSSVGRVIREFNSTMGIPAGTLLALKEIAIQCKSCYCMYSPEGYNAHVVDKKCRNSTFFREVHVPHEADVDTLRKLKLRSLASHGELHTIEFAETPIGIALLEFNSIIGVPLDVWATVTSAYVKCATCHLVRTFPGHRGHLDSTGTCHDVGDGVAVIDKGKGKEKEVDVTSSSLVDYDSAVENAD